MSTSPVPFLSLSPTVTIQRIPHNVTSFSRKVDKCKPVSLVHFSAQPEPFRH